MSIEEESKIFQLSEYIDDYNDFVHALIRHLDYIPELTELDLTWDRIGPEGAAALAQGLHHVPNLIRLYLGWNRIGPEGTAALAQGLHHVPNLTYLNLGWNRIGPEGAAALAEGLHHVPKLTHLDLQNNKIGDEGAVALAQGFHHVPNLTYLNLGWNRIGPKAISYLSYLLPSKVRMDIKIDKRVHPAVLSYILWMRSDFPFYDLLNAWKKTFGSIWNEKTVRNLLSW